MASDRKRLRSAVQTRSPFSCCAVDVSKFPLNGASQFEERLAEERWESEGGAIRAEVKPGYPRGTAPSLACNAAQSNRRRPAGAL
jgi:hypothetical protein